MTANPNLVSDHECLGNQGASIDDNATVGPNGDVLVTDFLNNRIQKWRPKR